MTFIQNVTEGFGKLISNEDSLINKKFIEQNFKKIIIAIILLMSYIQLRYNYENHLVNIGKLKQERNDVRYTSIEKWSILTVRNRPDVIRAKVAQTSVQLRESNESPVIVK